jgi:hypothetical protein
LTKSDRELLWEGRETIATGTIICILWIVVFTRTLFGSKLPFLFTLSSMFIIYSTLQIISTVLFNWGLFYEQKQLT